MWPGLLYWIAPIKSISTLKEHALGQCCLKELLLHSSLKATTLLRVWSKLPCLHYVLECTNTTAAVFRNSREIGTELVGNDWGTIIEGMDWWESLKCDCAPHENQLSRTCLFEQLHVWGEIICILMELREQVTILLLWKGLCGKHLYTLHKYS